MEVMKILNIEKNDFGQTIATVLNCGKLVKVVGPSKDDLMKQIPRTCKFVSSEDVRIDLELNFS